MVNGKNIKALVVDDEEIVRDFLVRLLSFRGVTVKAVDDGEKAVEEAKKEKFDIAFLDVRMPKIDGLETFRSLRKVSPDTKYVMMTGYAVDDMLKKAEEEGALVSLKKPFDISEVIKLLTNLFATESAVPLSFLVVDDDNTILNFFKTLFKDKKYDITLAQTGQETLEIIKKKKFDIVFLDVCLTDMSGLELYLKLQKEKPDLNVILMTGFTDKVTKLNKFEVKGCLYKPFDINKIFAEVDRIKKTKA